MTPFPPDGPAIQVVAHVSTWDVIGISAAADVAYNAGDETITGTMRYHQGDDIPFVWRRVRPPR